MLLESSGRTNAIALRGRFGQAYTEDAFRYLLGLERKRSARSGHPFLLVLVDLKEQTGAGVRIDPASAARILSQLWGCLRETDSVGWYREEEVAAALLPHVADGPRSELCRRVRERVHAALVDAVVFPASRILQIRVYLLQPRVKN
jgi:hypothetical protein